MTETASPIRLSIPAGQQYALVARMALSAMGVLAELDVDLIGDLRTVAAECIDCLSHQPMRAQSILLTSWLEDGRLYCAFEAEQRQSAPCDQPLELDITRGVLETLMPEVIIQSDEGGVKRIQCSLCV